MANGLGAEAFVNGVMRGRQFRQQEEEWGMRKQALETSQGMNDLRLSEMRREAEDAAGLRSQLQQAIPVPSPAGAAPTGAMPLANADPMAQSEIGPLGTTNFEPAEVKPIGTAPLPTQTIGPDGRTTGPLQGAIPLQTAATQTGQGAQETDPLAKLTNAYEKATSYWLSKGDADRASAAYDKLSKVREVRFFKAMSQADQQYQASGDPRVFLPVFNDAWDNGQRADIQPTGDPAKPWRVTVSNEAGQTRTLEPMSKQEIERLIGQMRDPQARRKAEIERDMLVFKSDLKMREEGYKANIEGQWKTAEAGMKDGRVGLKDQAGNAEILGARATLQRMGIADIGDKRFNERDEISGQLTAQAQELRDLWKLSRQHIVGGDDPQHAAMATGSGTAAQPAGGSQRVPNARQIEELKKAPDRAAEFDAYFGQGAAEKALGKAPATKKAAAIDEEALVAQQRAIVPQSEQPVPTPPGQPMFGTTQALPNASQPIAGSDSIQRQKAARRAFQANFDTMTAQDARRFQAEQGAYLTTAQIAALNKRITGATKPKAAATDLVRN